MADEPKEPDEKISLAERFAKKLAERGDAPGASLRRPQAAAPGPAPTMVEPVSTQPAVTPAAPPTGTPQPAAVDPGAGVIDIDFTRLGAAGFITPQTDEGATIEEFRLIKRQLMRLAFVEDGQKMRDNGNVIMVSSPVAGDGKSFVALNLAISFSLELDLYVLLVDADNRSHAVSKLLGVGNDDIGLVDLLVNDSLSIRDIIRRTTIPNLSFIAAGRPHRHGTELLASKHMATTLQDLTKRYPDRIIFIDTPPLLASTEGLVLAPHVGHTVVVVEKDRTTKKALNQTLQRLEICPEVSCVLYSDPSDRKNFAQLLS